MRFLLLSCWFFTLQGWTLPGGIFCQRASAAGGQLTLKAEEESDHEPTITRIQIWRGTPQGKMIPIRRTVPSGSGTVSSDIGVVLDRQVVLSLADGPYAFRAVRGPEYRVITGSFTLEPSSLDDHAVVLPRMVNMLDQGWTSGDCCVSASPNSLPLRMASEDLHLAASLGHIDAKPIPYRENDDPIGHLPLWTSADATHHDGLIFYGQQTEQKSSSPKQNSPVQNIPVKRIVDFKRELPDCKVAIENPFAWPLPVWLASQRVDGMFILGDWLRLDRKVMTIRDGRGPEGVFSGTAQSVGRWGEMIYRHTLDAGLRMPPLAGSGSDSAKAPVGYNRLYVTNPPRRGSGSQYNDDASETAVACESAADWWSGAWNGQSVATNGPLLRPKVAGKLPGHTFKAKTGEVLRLSPELSLSVRDPVEYLEVIHNNQVHYSARLDKFAENKGRIPAIETKESGWVLIRVVTLHEDHYRAAISAPWYIEFDGKPRVGEKSVSFFQDWLKKYEGRLKRLPPDQLQAHTPFVRAARKFWAAKADVAVK